VSAVAAIAESPEFHEFLISGIQSLKQANIVKPQAKAAAKRKSFLGIRGPSLPSFKEVTQTAEVGNQNTSKTLVVLGHTVIVGLAVLIVKAMGLQIRLHFRARWDSNHCHTNTLSIKPHKDV